MKEAARTNTWSDQGRAAPMTPAQRQAVLTVARNALEAAVRDRPPEPYPDVALPEEFGGAFVTLKKAGRLRGCMGSFKPMGSMAETVARVTRMSCLDDPRFAYARIEVDEVGDVAIEVSVLEEPQLTSDPLSLEVGRHGVWIHRGPRSGCLLPQVASERGWTAEEFLRQCCMLKAGLPADAWKDSETQTYLFGAEIIKDESQLGMPTD